MVSRTELDRLYHFNPYQILSKTSGFRLVVKTEIYQPKWHHMSLWKHLKAIIIRLQKAKKKVIQWHKEKISKKKVISDSQSHCVDNNN